MMIDFGRTIRMIDGEEMKLARAGREPVPMTLALVAIEALLGDDPQASASSKVERFMLASKIQAATEPLELSPESVTLIRERVGELCPTLICGRAYELLNG